MALNREAYQLLEEVVGPDNITQDPGITCTYRVLRGQMSGTPFVPTEGLPIPDAAITPGSVEELRQIAKICNKYGVKYKAHSTGIWMGAFPMGESALAIDLRRMNHIIEINEKDGYAVIEPYVTCGALHVEAMKRGMCSHITGGGPAFSVLAGATSVAGFGESGISRGFAGRNMLAVEWMLPDGEVLRMGSLDAPEGGWFCGDGPGPSLQGMMRGQMGACGERGIFTKIAIRLYPWSGPERIENTGGPPNYDVDLWDEGMFVVMSWLEGNYQKEADGIYALCEAEIFDSLMRNSTFWEGVMCHTDAEHAKLHESRIFWDHFKNTWYGIVDGKSQKHLEYCRKVLEKVEQETGATFFYTLEDFKESLRKRPDGEPYDGSAYEIIAENVEQVLLQSLVWRNWHYKSCFMPAYAEFAAPPCSTAALDALYKVGIEVVEPIQAKYMKEGKIMDDQSRGMETTWMQPEEGGHAFHMEMHIRGDRRDPNCSLDGALIEGIADKYLTGCPDYYFPNEVGSRTMGEVFLGIQDALDPKRLTSCMWTGVNEAFTGKPKKK